jgi:hypothetical protein
MDRIESGSTPVPVRLVASVPALISQSLFVRVHKVSVPAEEIGGPVNSQGLVDVSPDEIIVSGLGSRNQGLVCQSR